MTWNVFKRRLAATERATNLALFRITLEAEGDVPAILLLRSGQDMVFCFGEGNSNRVIIEPMGDKNA